MKKLLLLLLLIPSLCFAEITFPPGISGTWTPSLTNQTNVAASTAYAGQWIRIGNVVTGSFAVDIDPTLAATDTRLRLSSPVSSTWALFNNAAGTCVNNTLAGASAAILARTGGALLEIGFISDATAANNTWFCSFSYLVI